MYCLFKFCVSSLYYFEIRKSSAFAEISAPNKLNFCTSSLSVLLVYLFFVHLTLLDVCCTLFSLGAYIDNKDLSKKKPPTVLITYFGIGSNLLPHPQTTTSLQKCSKFLKNFFENVHLLGKLVVVDFNAMNDKRCYSIIFSNFFPTM